MGNHVEARRLPTAQPMWKLIWGGFGTAMAVIYTIICAPFAAITARLGMQTACCFISRWWAWLIIVTCGIKVEIEGLENLRGLDSYILVANHQSFFDIFAVLA
ncbi:MAG TPA: hypothetical protein VKR29_10810, partial [Candidatus Binataceae bacterium]|nr:hypothetical protein [Candidatus Binataceae bacterium]